MSSTNHHALYPEYSANAALVLIAVACSLLDRQIAALGRAFAEEGGFTERLYLHRRCIGARRLKSYPL